jgi:hypothetical protein
LLPPPETQRAMRLVELHRMLAVEAAAKARALMVENDPDERRGHLGQIGANHDPQPAATKLAAA